jgi:hypothetical protein
MLKRGMGGSGPSGKQPMGSAISGAGPPLGATKGYLIVDIFFLIITNKVFKNIKVFSTYA